MAKLRKLTPAVLRSIILEEKEKLINEADPIVQGVTDPEKVSADEVDAGAQAGTLEKDIDYIKALKIQEAKMKKYLKRIQEAKELLSKRLISKIK